MAGAYRTLSDISYCECESPLVIYDGRGQHCTLCGLPAKFTLKSDKRLSAEGVHTPYGQRGAKLPPADENGHRGRYSDASRFDEVCVLCGATDADSRFRKPCPHAVPDPQPKQELSVMEYQSDHVTDRSLLAGRVRRYHAWPVLKEQTVGDHCWGVYHVYWRIFGMPSAEVAFYIHHHDDNELVFGDNPFPMKLRYPKLKEAERDADPDIREQLRVPDASIGLSPEDLVRVKISDLLEMTQFGMQEREMGNLLATPIVQRTMRTACEMAKSRLSNEDYTKVLAWAMSEQNRHDDVIKKQGSVI